MAAIYPKPPRLYRVALLTPRVAEELLCINTFRGGGLLSAGHPEMTISRIRLVLYEFLAGARVQVYFEP